MTLQNYNTLLVLFQTFLAPLTGLPVEELCSQVVADCGDKLWTVVCCVFWPANACACFHLVENNEKPLKITKKYFFHRTHERLMQEHEEKCSFLALRCDSQTLVDTQKLVAPQQLNVNLVIFVRKPLVRMIKNNDLTHFLSILRNIRWKMIRISVLYNAYKRLKYKKTKFTWNCWGAKSFLVSTGIWESLLNAKKMHFSSCSCVSLTWVSRAYDEQWKKYFFGNFQAFFIVFDHVNACASMRLLVKIHNSSVWKWLLRFV